MSNDSVIWVCLVVSFQTDQITLLSPNPNVRADRDVMKGNEEFINGFAFFMYQTIIYAVLKI